MILKQSATYMAASLGAALTGVASVAIFTRMLAPAEYGVYAIAMAKAATAAALLFTWLRLSILRFQSEGGDVDLRRTALLGYAASALLAPIAIVLMPSASVASVAVMAATIVYTQMYALFDIGQETLRARQFVPAYVQTAILRSCLALLLGAIALQAEALAMLAHSRGSAAPYLALKMVYLAIYPLAVAGAVGVAALWCVVIRRAGALANAVSIARQTALVWALVALFGIVVVRSVAAVPRPPSTISEPLLQAGRWARAHIDPGCVDYLVADGYSAYWLHLAVLGNARSAPRSIDNDTYEPRQAVIRWIEPGGLPYAIVDEFSALPKDIRDGVDMVARFDPAAVVKRRGAATCAQ